MTSATGRMTAGKVCAFAHQFTGKERDSESGLDFMVSRYYGGWPDCGCPDHDGFIVMFGRDRLRDLGSPMPRAWTKYVHDRGTRPRMAGAMKNTLAINIIKLLLIFALFSHWQCFAQVISSKALEAPINGKTVVRFFYLPPNSYAHPPLIFRVATQVDGRLGTAPIVGMGGRTPFISITEMHNLIETLKRSRLTWKKSLSAERVSPIPTTKMTDRMEISIFFTSHPVQAYVPTSRLCQTLSDLDKAFVQPRALWEFQLYRVDYGCSVSDFNRNAFPQHDDSKLEK